MEKKQPSPHTQNQIKSRTAISRPIPQQSHNTAQAGSLLITNNSRRASQPQRSLPLEMPMPHGLGSHLRKISSNDIEGPDGELEIQRKRYRSEESEVKAAEWQMENRSDLSEQDHEFEPKRNLGVDMIANLSGRHLNKDFQESYQGNFQGDLHNKNNIFSNDLQNNLKSSSQQVKRNRMMMMELSTRKPLVGKRDKIERFSKTNLQGGWNPSGHRMGHSQNFPHAYTKYENQANNPKINSQNFKNVNLTLQTPRIENQEFFEQNKSPNFSQIHQPNKNMKLEKNLPNFRQTNVENLNLNSSGGNNAGFSKQNRFTQPEFYPESNQKRFCQNFPHSSRQIRQTFENRPQISSSRDVRQNLFSYQPTPTQLQKFEKQSTHGHQQNINHSGNLNSRGNLATNPCPVGSFGNQRSIRPHNSHREIGTNQVNTRSREGQTLAHGFDFRRQSQRNINHNAVNSSRGIQRPLTQSLRFVPQQMPHPNDHQFSRNKQTQGHTHHQFVSETNHKTPSNRQIYTNPIPQGQELQPPTRVNNKMETAIRPCTQAWVAHPRAQSYHRIPKPQNMNNAPRQPMSNHKNELSYQNRDRHNNSNQHNKQYNPTVPRYQSEREIFLKSNERRMTLGRPSAEIHRFANRQRRPSNSFHQSGSVDPHQQIYSMRKLNLQTERNVAIEELKKLQKQDNFGPLLEEPQQQQQPQGMGFDRGHISDNGIINNKKDNENMNLGQASNRFLVSKEKPSAQKGQRQESERKILNRTSFIQTKEMQNQGNLSNHSGNESQENRIFKSRRNLERTDSYLSLDPLIENKKAPFAAAFGHETHEPAALINSDNNEDGNNFQEIFAKNLDNSERGILQLDGPRLFPDAEIGAKSFTNISRNQEGGSMMFIGDGSNKLLTKPGMFQNNLTTFSGKFIGRAHNGTRMDSRRSFANQLGSEKRMLELIHGSGYDVMVSKHSIGNLNGIMPGNFNPQNDAKSQKSNLSGAENENEKYGNGNGMNFEQSQSNRIVNNFSNNAANAGIANLFVPKKLTNNVSPNKYLANNISSFKVLTRSGQRISTSTRQISEVTDGNHKHNLDATRPFYSGQKKQTQTPLTGNLEPFLENIREHSERFHDSNRLNSGKEMSSQSLLERDSLFKGFVARRNVFIGEGPPPGISQPMEPNFDSTRDLQPYTQARNFNSNRQIENSGKIIHGMPSNPTQNQLSFRKISVNKNHHSMNQMIISGSGKNLPLGNRPSMVSLKNHISSHKMVKLPGEQKKGLEEPWDLSDRNLMCNYQRMSKNAIHSLKHIGGEGGLHKATGVGCMLNPSGAYNTQISRRHSNLNIPGNQAIRGQNTIFGENVSLSPERRNLFLKAKPQINQRLKSPEQSFRKPSNVYIYSGKKTNSSNNFKNIKNEENSFNQNENTLLAKRNHNEAIKQTSNEPQIRRRISTRLMKRRRKLMIQKEENDEEEELTVNKEKKTKQSYKKKKPDWIRKLADSLPELTLEDAYPCFPSPNEQTKILAQLKQNIRKDLEISLNKADLGPRQKHSNLLKTIITLFVIGDIHPGIESLTQDQRGILHAIFYRKFKKRVDLSLEGRTLGIELQQIVSQSCMKKNEERWKFTYKKTLKHLKTLFYQRANSFKSVPNERDFLKFYFQKASDEKKLPLEYFHDPLIQKYRKRKSRIKDPLSPKSINTWYLSLIFGSPRFVRDFFQYVEGDFRRESLKEIPDKFFLIFDTYLGKKNGGNKKAEKNEGQDSKNNIDENLENPKVSAKKKIYTNGKEYFEQNKRCKLPWTFFDVDQAVQAVKLVWKDLTKSHNENSKL